MANETLPTKEKGDLVREILFRGRATRDYMEHYASDKPYIKKGDWLFGNLIIEKSQYANGYYIKEIESPFNNHWVAAETVGQYTGMTDKGKNKMFEGDLYKSDEGYIFEVVYLESEACFVGVPVDYPKAWIFLEDVADMERAGNKWDNPELLEVE